MKKENWWKKYDSTELCLSHYRQFNSWWDPEKYDWKQGSHSLAEFCFNDFDKWWDADKYDWVYDSAYLLNHCHEHFDKWWDVDKFDWEDSEHLVYLYVEKFSVSDLKKLLLHPNKIIRQAAAGKIKIDQKEKQQ